MRRSLTPEIMDDANVPQSLLTTVHRDLNFINRLLGNTRTLIERLRREPVASVIDIGCGDGALLNEIRRQLAVRVTGVDLRVPPHDTYGIPIVAADATRDPLPEADTAVCLLVLHHLAETQVIDLIRNVGRSCGRLICLDLVRHPLPLALYTAFICPFVHKVTALDGRQSIRRAYTPDELRSLIHSALAGTEATFEHCVSPMRASQIVDITYRRS